MLNSIVAGVNRSVDAVVGIKDDFSRLCSNRASTDQKLRAAAAIALKGAGILAVASAYTCLFAASAGGGFVAGVTAIAFAAFGFVVAHDLFVTGQSVTYNNHRDQDLQRMIRQTALFRPVCDLAQDIYHRIAHRSVRV